MIVPLAAEAPEGPELLHLGLVQLEDNDEEQILIHSLTEERRPLPAEDGPYVIKFDSGYAFLVGKSGSSRWAHEFLHKACYEDDDGIVTVWGRLEKSKNIIDKSNAGSSSRYAALPFLVDGHAVMLKAFVVQICAIGFQVWWQVRDVQAALQGSGSHRASCRLCPYLCFVLIDSSLISC